MAEEYECIVVEEEEAVVVEEEVVVVELWVKGGVPWEG